MNDPKLSVYFAGGREIVIDTSANETDFTIGKNTDGSYTINLRLVVAPSTAKGVIGDFEDLDVPDGTPFTVLRNILYLENAYEPGEVLRKPAAISPKVANLVLSGFPKAMGAATPLQMLFDVRFTDGGKTDQGGIKTDQGGVA